MESGKQPATRVRRRISRFSRSIMLFVRGLILWFDGGSPGRQAVVLPIPSRRRLAAGPGFPDSVLAVAVPVLASAASRDSRAKTAFSAEDAHSLWLGGVLESTLRMKCARIRTLSTIILHFHE